MKYMRISRWNIRGLQSFLFQSNEASILEHIPPIFSIYSVELGLLDRVSDVRTYDRVE
jgi:hypothetical protein